MDRKVFRGELNIESISDLVDWVDNTEIGKLYISSNGGHVDATQALIDSLNDNQGIDIHCYNMMSSAALDLILQTKNKVFLTKYFTGCIIHQMNNELDVIGVRSNDVHTIEVIALAKKIDEEDMKTFSKVLTPEEIKEYYNGRDVFINRDRTQKLLEIIGK